MKPKSATFVTSAVEPSGFPRPTVPEIAFAGRSNVGKSSLINTLVGAPGLARASNTPGRTRMLNWFHVVPQKGMPMHFVDLPGYGYARVPRPMRESWQPLVEAYLCDRAVLRVLFLLIDARRGAQDEEVELLAWLAQTGVPVTTVVTKSDKLAKNKRKPMAFAIKRDLSLNHQPVLFSAHTGEGLSDLWRIITRWMSTPTGR